MIEKCPIKTYFPITVSIKCYFIFNENLDIGNSDTILYIQIHNY